jgi:hypothetical protein
VILAPFLHAVFVGSFEFIREPGPDFLVKGEAGGVVFQDGEKEPDCCMHFSGEKETF